MENADGMLGSLHEKNGDRGSLHEKNGDRKLQSIAIKKVNAGSI